LRGKPRAPCSRLTRPLTRHGHLLHNPIARREPGDQEVNPSSKKRLREDGKRKKYRYGMELWKTDSAKP
jgi:hypothetical protein